MSLNSLLAKSVSVANTDVIAYTVPAGKQFANVSLVLVNTGGSPSSIEVAISEADVPVTADYIEKGTQLAANGGSLRRTNLIMSAGEKIIVKAGMGTVGIRIFGLEQA